MDIILKECRQQDDESASGSARGSDSAASSGTARFCVVSIAVGEGITPTGPRAARRTRDGFADIQDGSQVADSGAHGCLAGASTRQMTGSWPSCCAAAIVRFRLARAAQIRQAHGDARLQDVGSALSRCSRNGFFPAWETAITTGDLAAAGFSGDNSTSGTTIPGST